MEKQRIQERKRRFFAFAMALAMMLSLLPVSAWATNYNVKGSESVDGIINIETTTGTIINVGDVLYWADGETPDVEYYYHDGTDWSYLTSTNGYSFDSDSGLPTTHTVLGPDDFSDFLEGGSLHEKAGSFSYWKGFTETVKDSGNAYVSTKAVLKAFFKASVTDAPTAATGLTTADTSSALLKTAGTPTGGTMQYALGTNTEPTGSFSGTIPTVGDTNGGTGDFYVWYKVAGDALTGYADSDAAGPVEVTIGAPPHVHDWSYAAGTGENANQITATCTAGCPDSPATLTLAAPAHTTYGDGKDEKAILTGDTFPIAVDSDSVKYVGRGGTTYGESNTAPTAPGNYTAKITLTDVALPGGGTGNVTASVDYAIGKASPGTPTVTMSGYAYGGAVPAPSVSTNPGGGAVTYYYNTTNSNSGGTAWTGITGTSLNAGTYYMYAVIAETDNYSGYTTETTSFTITGGTITASAADVTAPYDGNPHGITVNVTAPASGSTVRYGLAADSCTANASPTITNVSDSPKTIYYKVTADNYNDFTGSATVTINAKEAVVGSGDVVNPAPGFTITGSPVSFTYNGASQAPTLTVKDGDKTLSQGTDYTVAYAGTGTTTYASSATAPTNVGSYQAVLTFMGNYGGGKAKIPFTITQKALTITAGSDTKVYDGTELTKDSYTNTTLAEGDSIESVTVTGSQTVVGSSNNVPSGAVIKRGNTDVTASYAITYTNGTLEVTQKAVTITADSDSKVYDGTALTKDSYTNTALATGDSIESVTVTGSQTVVGSSNNVPSGAVIKRGNTDVTASYAITYTNGTLEVTRKAATVTADNKEKTYGAADPALTATVAGTIGSDVLTYTVNRQSGENVNTYTITPTGETTQGNYTVAYNTGTFTINQKEVVGSGGVVEVPSGDDSYTSGGITVSMPTRTYEYDGTAKAPVPTVTVTSGSAPVEGTDYTLAYYTNTGTLTTPINVGSYYVSVVFQGNYSGTVKIPFTITQKAVTVTADSDTKVYDGTPLIKNSYTNTALAAGDSIDSVTVTGSQTVKGTSNNVPSGAVIKRGDTNMTANYAITYANGTLEVTQRVVTLNWSDTELTYNGSEQAPTATVTNRVGSDVCDVTVTGGQTNVGSYTATADELTGTNAGNYKLPDPKPTTLFTIGKATFAADDITVTDYNKPYDGAAHSIQVVVQSGAVVTYSENGSDYSNTNPSYTNCGSYTVHYKVTQAGYNDATGTGTVTITKKPVTVSGITAGNKTYDGNTSATLTTTAAAFDGKVDGDELTVTGTGAFDNKNVGKVKTVTISGLTLGGAAAGNYKLAETGNQTSTTADITAKSVTVSGITAQNKPYDGNTSATLITAAATFVGKVVTDELTVSGTGTFADADVADNKTVTISGLTLDGTDAGNYQVDAVNSQKNTTANIFKAAAPALNTLPENQKPTVNRGATGVGLVYNGAAQALVKNPESALAGYIVQYALSTSAAAEPAAAAYSAVIPEGTNAGTYYVWYKLKGDANHEDTAAACLTSTISPLTGVVVTITGNNNTATYDGNEHSVSGYTAAATGDNGLYDVNNYISFTGTAAAARTDTGQTNMNLAAGQFANTSANFTGVNFNVTDGYQKINAKEVPVSSGNITEGSDFTAKLPYNSIPYDGNVHKPAVTVMEGTNPLTLGTDYTVQYTDEGGTAFTGEAGPINAGNYKAVITFAGNYKSSDEGTVALPFTITPREVSVTWGNTSLTYNGTEQAPTATVTNRVGNDVCNVTVTGGQTNANNATTLTYTATADALSNANYKLPTPKPTTTFTIGKAAVTVSGIGAADKEYDGNTTATVTGTGTLTGVLAADMNNVTLTPGTASFADKNVGTGKTVTFSDFSLTGTAADNYTLSQPANVTANITAKAVTVSGITAGNKTYDGNTSATLTTTAAAFDGKVDGDELTVTGTGAFDNKNVGKVKTVTISGLTLGGAAAGNYKLAETGNQTSTTADITAKSVTVSGITAQNKPYDGNTSATLITAAATFVGKVVTDELTVSGTGTFADADVADNKTVTISGLTLDGTDAGNYQVDAVNSQKNTTANIFKAAAPALNTLPENQKPTVNRGATGVGLVYNGAAQALVKNPESALAGYIVQYALSTSAAAEPAAAAYSAVIPEGTNAGTYYVWYKLKGDANHEDTAAACLTSTISPLTGVVVTITGNNNTATYDGNEHSVSGYTAAANTALYDVNNDISFTGTAAAARTDAGQTNMNLAADQFANTSANFTGVSFDVTDGYQKIDAKDAVVVSGDVVNPADGFTITGNPDSFTYTGDPQAPTLTVKDGDNGLREGPDYTVAYAGTGATAYDSSATAPTNVGSYQAVVTFSANYGGGRCPIAFAITKADIHPVVTITGWTRGQTANAPSVTGNPGNGDVTYEYKVKDADDSTYSPAVPADAGQYTVRATVAETANYNGGTATADFTISATSGRSGGGGGGWQQLYAITVLPASHGAVQASAATAAAREKITLTVTPEDGWQFDTMQITDRNEKTVSYTRQEDGKYSFVMPASDVTVTAQFKDGTLTPPEDTQPGDNPFKDVKEDDWFSPYVKDVVERGLMNGIGDDQFGPMLPFSRAMLAAVLYRMAGSPAVEERASFSDVSESAWYADAVSWAAKNQIIFGYSDGKFGPNDPVTREQMATMIWRFAKYQGLDVSASADLSGYQDAGSISKWALEAMRWANAVGLMNGRSADLLVPTGELTRAEAAAILSRYCDLPA